MKGEWDDEGAKNIADLDHFGLRARILQKTFSCACDTPLDEITVSTICQESGISRTTFYRLFTGKDDVFGWFFRVALRSNIAQVGDVFPWSQAFQNFFRWMDANRKLASMFIARGGSIETYVDLIERALTHAAMKRFEDAGAHACCHEALRRRGRTAAAL